MRCVATRVIRPYAPVEGPPDVHDTAGSSDESINPGAFHFVGCFVCVSVFVNN